MMERKTVDWMVVLTAGYLADRWAAGSVDMWAVLKVVKMAAKLVALMVARSAELLVAPMAALKERNWAAYLVDRLDCQRAVAKADWLAAPRAEKSV